jgi:hypothetical protein
MEIRSEGGEMKRLLITLIFLWPIFLIKAAHHERLKTEALVCAWNSEGTDMEIVQCYLTRDLETPDGL